VLIWSKTATVRGLLLNVAAWANFIVIELTLNVNLKTEQEAQLMLTTGSTRLAVNQGQQT